MKEIVNILSLWALPLIISTILVYALIKKVPVYESFTKGAKDGVDVTLRIIPYLTAIIVAIAMFRASGALDVLGKMFFEYFNFPQDILPLAIIRSMSGSAAIGIFSDIASANPPDSFTTKLAAIMLGSSETTFYVLSVYFGAVGIKKYRYALPVGLICDSIGIALSFVVAGIFFK